MSLVQTKYSQALTRFRAIDLNPKFTNAYYNRAIAYEKLGKTKEAKADNEKAKELGKTVYFK